MTTEKEAIAETITAHDLLLKKLWCIAYEEGQKAEREFCAKVCDSILGENNVSAAIRSRF